MENMELTLDDALEAADRLRAMLDDEQRVNKLL